MTVRTTFTVLTLLFVLQRINSLYLANRDQIGTKLRKYLWIAADAIKNIDSDSQIQQSLWDFSFRGLTLEVLNGAILEEAQRQQVRTLLQSYEDLNEQLRNHRNLKDPSIDPPSQDEDSVIDHQSATMDLDEQYTKLMEQLRDLVLNNLNKDKDWQVNYAKVNNFKQVLLNFQMLKSDRAGLEEFLLILANETDLAEQVPTVQAMLPLFAGKESLEKVLGLLEAVNNNNDSTLNSQIYSLQTAIAALKAEADTHDKDFVSKVLGAQNEIKEQLKQNPNYVQYTQTLKEVKALKEKMHQTKKSIIQIKDNYEREKQEYLLASWKRTRVSRGQSKNLSKRLSDIEAGLIELQNQENMELHHNKEYFDTLNSILNDHNSYQTAAIQSSEYYEKEIELLNQILPLETQIDQQFAILLADLMNRPSQQDYVFFSPREMSVLMYFMSVAKVVSDQTSFLHTFMVHLNARKCQDLVSRMKIDLLQEEDIANIPEEAVCLLSPNQLTEEENPNAVLSLNSDFIRDYSLFMSGQKVHLFQNQIINKQETWFMAFMNYLGINRESILYFFKKLVIAKFCAYLTSSLLILIGVLGSIPLMSTAAIITVSYIVNYLLGYISSSMPDSAQIKNAIHKALIPVYEAIYGNEFESLDYIDILKTQELQHQDHFMKKLKRPTEQVPAQFRLKFEAFDRESWMLRFAKVQPVVFI